MFRDFETSSFISGTLPLQLPEERRSTPHAMVEGKSTERLDWFGVLAMKLVLYEAK